MTHYDTCGAPICSELGETMWYPGEDICNLKPAQPYQKMQRRIERLYKADKMKYPYYYFTIDMLENIKRLTPTVRGLDPELDEDEQRAAGWFLERYSEGQTAAAA